MYFPQIENPGPKEQNKSDSLQPPFFYGASYSPISIPYIEKEKDIDYLDKYDIPEAYKHQREQLLSYSFQQPFYFAGSQVPSNLTINVPEKANIYNTTKIVKPYNKQYNKK